MSMISELVERLKRYARFSKVNNPSWSEAMAQAADVIEALSEKLQITNENGRWIPCDELRQQGRLLELPCAVGDTVYALMSVESSVGYTVEKMQVKNIILKQSPLGNAVFMLEPVGRRGSLYKYYDKEYGKLVFIKPEAAEEALKQMREGADTE